MPPLRRHAGLAICLSGGKNRLTDLTDDELLQVALTAPHRVRGILRKLDKAGIIPLADKGHQRDEASVVTHPHKGSNKPESQKQANRSHAKLRRPGEHANTQLKSWKLLRKLRFSPGKAGHLVKAIAVLQNSEVTHI